MFLLFFFFCFVLFCVFVFVLQVEFHWRSSDLNPSPHASVGKYRYVILNRLLIEDDLIFRKGGKGLVLPIVTMKP